MNAPVDNILPRLDGVKPTGQGKWLARCPAHDDKSPSLAIRETEDGRLLMHDFAGCEVEAIVHALGLTISDLFPPRPQYKPGSRAKEPHIHAIDALRALANESAIILIAAKDTAAGKALSDSDCNRLAVSINRIQEACHVIA